MIHIPHTQYGIIKPISVALVLCMSLVVLGTFFEPVFATKNFTTDKTYDVKESYLFKTFADVTSYNKIFPNYIQSIEKISVNDQDTVRIIGNVQGNSFDAEAIYSTPYSNTFVMEIISGDLKGTKMTITLTPTFGFNGSPSGGTKTHTEITLETSWWISALMLAISNDSIKSGIQEQGIDKIADYAKNIQSAESKKNVSQSIPNQSTPKTVTISSTQQDPQSAPTNVQTIHTQQNLTVQEPVKPQTIQKSHSQPRDLDTNISLQSSSYSVYTDSDVMFSGRLTDATGMGVPNAQVNIKNDTPFWFDSTISNIYTDNDGNFMVHWQAKKPHWYSNVANLYADFEGSPSYSTSRSPEIKISVQ